MFCVRHKLNPYNLLHGAVFLEKLIVLQLFKKFYAFYGNRSFTIFTTAHHFSCPEPDQCSLGLPSLFI